MQCNKIPVLSVVGKSNTGKTTLVTKLVHELKTRGYKVATIKHSHHTLELDKEGKDSWLHMQAGADAVAVVSKNITGIIRRSRQELPLSEIIRTHLYGMDIIIAEGYKTMILPKVEVYRSEICRELLCKNDQNLLAIIGDRRPEIDIPFFYIEDNVRALVDFLLLRLKKTHG